MPELKSGWTRVRFGDVVRQSKEKADPVTSGLERFVAGEHMDTDELRIRRWGTIGDGYLGPAFTARFSPGQVLYGSRRTYLRKVALADFDGICANTTFVLESVNPKVLLPELLPFIMQTEAFHEHSKRESKGSVNPYVNFSDLAWYEFSLPPLEEQRRLALLLTGVYLSQEANKRALEKCVRMRDSFLNDSFDYEDNDDLVNLGYYCGIQVGFPFKSTEYVVTGDRLLRCSNVKIGVLEWLPSETKFWPTSRRNEFEDYILAVGDIVLAMDRPFIGDGFKCARVREADLPALLLQRVGRFKPNKNANLGFLWAFINSISFSSQLRQKQKGMDLPHISRYDIEGVQLKEITLKQQMKIAEQFIEIENFLESLRKRISETDLLRRITSTCLFNGQC